MPWRVCDPGVTLQQANTYLNRKAEENIASEGNKSFGRASGWGMFAMPLTEFIGGNLRKPLTMLLIAVGMVLLIACANIAGLQMARASARERDLAIRVALGAQQVRLLRQALVESIVLTVAGVALGFAVALATAPLLVRSLPDAGYPDSTLLPRASAAVCDGYCGAVLAAVRAGSGVAAHPAGMVQRAAGGWPLGHQRPGAPARAIVAGGGADRALVAVAGGRGPAAEQPESAGASRDRLPAQRLALGALLAAAVGLWSSPPAASASAVKEEAAKQAAAAQDASDAKIAAFYSALQDRLHGIPGVSSAALADSVPFDNQGGSSSFFIKGANAPPNDPGPHGNVHIVSPEYFATLRVPLVMGRDFTPQDRAGTELVAMIDTVLAHQYWPGKNPIGEHIGFNDRVKGPWYTIVGLVAHARASSLESDTNEGFYYLTLRKCRSCRPPSWCAVRARPGT